MDREQLRELVRDLLDVDGDLLRSHKVFTRTNLVAELAPRLYGQDPALLDEALDLALGGPDVVPLIGVANARERAYTTIDVLTAERTIATTVGRLVGRPGRSVPPPAVEGAVRAKEADLGGTLTTAQREAVEALCTSTGAATVIVGVAGAGKTTALDAAASVLEAAGWRVIGSSTSGQATRTLGEEAHIASRTLASLLWRLDHHQERLDERTVVIVDEAGMASDADLARLLLAVDRAGAQLALVGDPQQLSPVGPGGALAEIVASHPEAVVSLTENARQQDPREREALVELRNGSAAVAARWYADHGRVAIAPTRVETLVQMVDAWSSDAHGKDTVMLAWRREDVADLNRLARQRRAQLGQLHGLDVEAPGGRHYAIGDVVVTLAPNHRVGLVTSERLLIVDAEPGPTHGHHRRRPTRRPPRR